MAAATAVGMCGRLPVTVALVPALGHAARRHRDRPRWPRRGAAAAVHGRLRWPPAGHGALAIAVPRRLQVNEGPIGGSAAPCRA